MAKQEKVRVEEDGRRRFITVASGRAMDLHYYLRGNGVHSSPPAPSYTGYDSIELAGSIDVGDVQALLNAWK